MNKFRHIILLLAFIVGLTAYAQHSHPLLGIWQQEIITQEGNRILIPVWKIISGDGTFSVILMTKDNGRTRPLRATTLSTRIRLTLNRSRPTFLTLSRRIQQIR